MISVAVDDLEVVVGEWGAFPVKADVTGGDLTLAVDLNENVVLESLHLTLQKRSTGEALFAKEYTFAPVSLVKDTAMFTFHWNLVGYPDMFNLIR